MGSIKGPQGPFLLAVKYSMNIQKYSIHINEDVSEKVINLSTIIPSTQASNSGGWQGVINNKSIDWVEELRNLIETITQKKTERFWFNINGPGNSNVWHKHFLNCHAAVLYIKTPYNSGNIEFRDEKENLIITPNVGDLLVFPGSLEHRVTENRSQDVRISLATNLK